MRASRILAKTLDRILTRTRDRVPAALALCALLVASLLMVVALGGCQKETVPRLIQVLDIAPREVEVGDRLEVIGAGFPQGKTAHLTFDGKLHRPGERTAVTDPAIEVDGVVTSPEQIEIPFTEGLQALFCGVGDKATHTTFKGEISVTFPAAAPGAPPISDTLKAIAIDFRPPTARRAVLEARAEEGERALRYLGITLSPNSPSAGGLLVGEVEPGSRADRARVLTGDLITSFDGVHVVSKADAVPSGAEPFVYLGIKRGSAVEETVPVAIDGFKPAPPTDLLGAALVLGVAAAIILLFMAPTAGIITWVERRVSARMQSRVGPNRAGPQGFLIWMADGIKSIMKEDIVPTDSDKPLFRLAPYLVFAGVSATFCVMPFGQYLIAADLDIGILFIVAVTSLVTIGLMTGGWASNNKYSMLGGIRSAAQIISYEVPGAVAIVCIVMMTGSLRLQEIIRAQGGLGSAWYEIGGWPWNWFMFRNPITFALFFLYFTTALAEGNRAPFDLPEAESELVAGYSTEYSGMRYLFFFFAEWANVFVMCGIATALFLGGWQLPGVASAQQEANFGLQLAGSILFLGKAWFLVFVVIWIRWTLPRVRIDQMMNLCWKWFVPLSFGAFLLTAGWVVLSPSRGVQQGLGGAMFLLFCGLVAYFWSRVLYNLRETRAEIHLNPFI
jgi:NADH-quinone oxidoreductase subunit H